MIRNVISQYQDIVEKYELDPVVDYFEQIIYFIDKEYHTTYRDNNMDDEIEKIYHNMMEFDNLSIGVLSVDQHYKMLFKYVEKIYKVASEKYPKLKDVTQLNPSIRHVNSFHVFEIPFNNFINNSEKEQCEKLKEELISKYPKCKDLIINEFEYDDTFDSFDDIKWFIPKDEIIEAEYEALYIEGINYEY